LRETCNLKREKTEKSYKWEVRREKREEKIEEGEEKYLFANRARTRKY
jgi:hypothetical protein